MHVERALAGGAGSAGTRSRQVEPSVIMGSKLKSYEKCLVLAILKECYGNSLNLSFCVHCRLPIFFFIHELFSVLKKVKGHVI